MATYDFTQQTFCLSMLGNLSSQYCGTPESVAAQAKADILKVLPDPTIQALIGTWDLVWGPVVVVSPINGEDGSKAINTMSIFKNASLNSFVLGIAGTNGSSIYDWVAEDFWVNEQVEWPFLNPNWAKPTPLISTGTNFGLNKLLGMTDRGASARDFLRDHISQGSNVMVTGHSLGGALSPSYTLYLKDTEEAWNPNELATIQNLATAGPTPGDSNFVDYFTDRIGDVYQRTWNSIDVVPHAWQADMLAKVPGLYVPTIMPTQPILAIAAAALFISRNGDYQQLNNTPGFASEVQGESGKTTLARFLKELLYQHIQAYYNHFQVLDFQEREGTLLGQSTAAILMNVDMDAAQNELLDRLITEAQRNNIPDVDITQLNESKAKI